MRFVPFFDTKSGSVRSLKLYSCAIDDYDNPLWDEYGISAVPTIILFEEGTDLRSRLDGRLGRGLSEDRFSVWLKELNQA